LAATAEALEGLGDRFRSVDSSWKGDLAAINPRIPNPPPRENKSWPTSERLYANATPDLFDGLDNVVATARTLNNSRGNIDQALMPQSDSATPGADIFERGAVSGA